MDIESINSSDFSSDKEDIPVDNDSMDTSVESDNKGQDTTTVKTKKHVTWKKQINTIPTRIGNNKNNHRNVKEFINLSPKQAIQDRNEKIIKERGLKMTKNYKKTHHTSQIGI